MYLISASNKNQLKIYNLIHSAFKLKAKKTKKKLKNEKKFSFSIIIFSSSNVL